MKKLIVRLELSLIIFLLGVVLFKGQVVALADWWSRDQRPVAPTIARDRLPSPSPTSPPQPTPTTPPVGGLPSPTPTQAPSAPPSGEGEGVAEDPCASGKSFTGSYCGWSPAEEERKEEIGRVGGPEILGLSTTSGENLGPSDIILLAGVLCLLLYFRSKLGKVKLV